MRRTRRRTPWKSKIFERPPSKFACRLNSAKKIWNAVGLRMDNSLRQGNIWFGEKADEILGRQIFEKTREKKGWCEDHPLKLGIKFGRGLSSAEFGLVCVDLGCKAFEFFHQRLNRRFQLREDAFVLDSAHGFFHFSNKAFDGFHCAGLGNAREFVDPHAVQ